jgi:ferredoxin-NADP reductase
MVVKALLGYRFAEQGNATQGHDGTITVAEPGGEAVRFFVQPVDSNRSIIRGIFNASTQGDTRIRVLRHHDWLLEDLRNQIEAEAAKGQALAPMEPVIARVSQDLVDIPAYRADGRTAEIRVTVVEKTISAQGIVSLRLEALKDQLPPFQPGSHIDLHLPNGLIRQYSLINGPGETAHYTIGVKRDAESRGGSVLIHDSLRQGDVLAVSAPRNNFPLRRDAVHTVFIAGGIGLTPLVAMARALNAQRLSFEFHYFAQSKDHVAFKDELTEFADALIIHEGLSPDETREMLQDVLGRPGHARHLYVCGPGPMLEAARTIAAHKGWDDRHVHFEYFKNTTKLDNSNSFEISLARSALTLTVPPEKTILEILRENGMNLGSSCEQGACGTCRCGVIEGEIHHQDVYLSEREKAEGKSIITCVSRAASGRLILDI